MTDAMAPDPNSGFIRFEVDKVSTLDADRRFSPEVEVGGLPWKVGVSRPDSNSLGVYLHHRRSSSNIWSVDVSTEIAVVSNGGRNSNSNYKKTFQGEVSSWGFRQHDTWQNLTDEENGFVNEDKIIVEVRFTLSNIKRARIASRVDFTDADEPCHDVALVINGEKIYVSKQILAVHSPVFKTMFFGKFVERDMKEIELKGLDRKEFIQMLEVIYPPYEKTTADNVESLLKMADRFQIQSILDQVEQFLIDSKKYDISSKLKLSDQFQLAKLLDHCFDSLEAVKDIQSLKTNDVYEALSDKTRLMLLDKVMKLG